MDHSQLDEASRERAAWNAGKKVGAKRPLTQKQIWAVRFFLDRERRFGTVPVRSGNRQQASGLRPGQDQIRDVVAGPEIRTRAIVVQQKTGRPVQFEITGDVERACWPWLERRGGNPVEDYAFPSRIDHAHHMSTRQYAASLTSG